MGAWDSGVNLPKAWGATPPKRGPLPGAGDSLEGRELWLCCRGTWGLGVGDTRKQMKGLYEEHVKGTGEPWFSAWQGPQRPSSLSAAHRR